MDLTHFRCGGTLTPEPQPYWTVADGNSQPPTMSPARMETLHRCGRCGLVGIAATIPARTRSVSSQLPAKGSFTGKPVRVGTFPGGTP